MDRSGSVAHGVNGAGQTLEDVLGEGDHHDSLGVIGVATQILQLINIVRLNLFWPFFLVIVFHLIAALLQFARMVLLLPEKV